MFCAKCGTKIEEGVGKCPSCGREAILPGTMAAPGTGKKKNRLIPILAISAACVITVPILVSALVAAFGSGSGSSRNYSTDYSGSINSSSSGSNLFTDNDSLGTGGNNTNSGSNTGSTSTWSGGSSYGSNNRYSSTARVCTYCGGKGYTTCTTCNGKGTYTVRGYTPNYSGSSSSTNFSEEKECPSFHCNGGKRDCPYC